MSSVTTPPQTLLQADLLAVAEALDNKEPREALRLLNAFSLDENDQTLLPLALALWKGTVKSLAGTKNFTDEDALRACHGLDKLYELRAEKVASWEIYRHLKKLEMILGARPAASIAWLFSRDAFVTAEPWLLFDVLQLYFAGDELSKLEQVFTDYLKRRKDYVPNYWTIHLYAKCQLDLGNPDFHGSLRACLAACDRGDLEPLFGIYLALISQQTLGELKDDILAVQTKAHRDAIRDYLYAASFEPRQTGLAAQLFAELSDDTTECAEAQALLSARCALAEKRWDDVGQQCQAISTTSPKRPLSSLLTANALAQTGAGSEAFRMLTDLSRDPEADKFLRSRAILSRAFVDRLERQVANPSSSWLRAPNPSQGRPLAQSLWIGPKLRWVEHMCLQSFLNNGWRFQLYVYDEVGNVPNGVEVLDANVIVPRKKVFREGASSGLHAGSVGAFSDLFRYRLLFERGGMWVDTDVINFHQFVPDGHRFISTEIVDGGLQGLNGAMMALPAGDPFAEQAYTRAEALMASEELFFTRIGPMLLAELLVEERADDIQLMSTEFLNPVPWMRTAKLLQPYNELMQDPNIANAINIHVYTETWRLIGLNFDAPPEPDTFLGHLYETVTRQ